MKDIHSQCITLIVAVLAATTVFYGFLSVSEYYTYQQSRVRLNVQHRQNLELTERVDHIKQDVQSLRSSTRSLEKQVRNRSLVVGEDEELVYFKSKPE